jgi:hypothetical protein
MDFVSRIADGIEIVSVEILVSVESALKNVSVLAIVRMDSTVSKEFVAVDVSLINTALPMMLVSMANARILVKERWIVVIMLSAKPLDISPFVSANLDTIEQKMEVMDVSKPDVKIITTVLETNSAAVEENVSTRALFLELVEEMLNVV